MKQICWNDEWVFSKQEFSDETMPVSLPHDAMLHESRSAKCDNDSNTGYFPGGRYCYRKVFKAPETWRGQTVFVKFEAVYQRSQIYLNGKKIGAWQYGYTGFSVELTNFLEFGRENILEVYVDNIGKNSRWYSGSGIFRDVWLLLGNACHIKENGIRISLLNTSPVELCVETQHDSGTVRVSVYDQDRLVAEGCGDQAILQIQNAHFWSDRDPYLYSVYVALENGGETVEEHIIRYGIRTIGCDATGLTINGQSVKLRGACIHHDNGLLGACSYRDAEFRKAKILKQAGFNAIRSAHQPLSEAMLEACDQYGLYVMDEAFDMWYIHKNPNDYASDFPDWYERDLKKMVDKDLNHPSVIMYSIGNEISETAQPEGIAYAKKLSRYLREADPSRLVTCGLNFMLNYFISKGKGIYSNEKKGRVDESESIKKLYDSKVGSAFINVIINNIGKIKNIICRTKRADRYTAEAAECLDVVGYNYAAPRYQKDGSLHPGRVIVGSETFPPDLAKNWRLVSRLSYLIGDYMWTGWEYLGESGIGVLAYNYVGAGTEKKYPYIHSGSGVIDLLGNVTPEVYWNKAIWGLNDGTPYLAVEPLTHAKDRRTKSAWRKSNAIHSWSWTGCKGLKTTVRIYTSADEAELYLNGCRVGKKKVKNCIATFHLVYRDGELTAKAYRADGTLLGTDVLRTARGMPAVSIKREEPACEDGKLIYLALKITDKSGTVFSGEKHTLTLFATGDAELLACGSADPAPEESYLTNTCATYYGVAQAILRKTAEHGDVVVRVCSDLQTQTVKIHF